MRRGTDAAEGGVAERCGEVLGDVARYWCFGGVPGGATLEPVCALGYPLNRATSLCYGCVEQKHRSKNDGFNLGIIDIL